MRIAVINITTKVVENVIIATLDDPLPDNCTGVVVDDYAQVSPGWVWVDGTSFVNPEDSAS